MSSFVHISEEDFETLLNWDNVFDAVETALEGLSQGFASQGASSRTSMGSGPNFMALLPGYINHEKYGGLCCKLFTVKPNSEKTYVYFLDPNTGDMKAIIHGKVLFSGWRTAAASLIAAKHLHGLDSCKPNKILAVCGAGNQGRLHAIAFQHFFNFEEVRIWNRSLQRAKDLVAKLNTGLEKPLFVVADTVENCLKNADVIVAATPGNETIVKYAWIKPGAHVTAIGVNPNKFELDPDTYKKGHVFVDSTANAEVSLKHIKNLGVEFKGQIGDVIAKKISVTDLDAVTIFQSLGMGVEDCAVARVIYDAYIAKSKL